MLEIIKEKFNLIFDSKEKKIKVSAGARNLLNQRRILKKNLSYSKNKTISRLLQTTGDKIKNKGINGLDSLD